MLPLAPRDFFLGGIRPTSRRLSVGFRCRLCRGSKPEAPAGVAVFARLGSPLLRCNLLVARETVRLACAAAELRVCSIELARCSMGAVASLWLLVLLLAFSTTVCTAEIEAAKPSIVFFLTDVSYQQLPNDATRSCRSTTPNLSAVCPWL